MPRHTCQWKKNWKKAIGRGLLLGTWTCLLLRSEPTPTQNQLCAQYAECGCRGNSATSVEQGQDSRQHIVGIAEPLQPFRWPGMPIVPSASNRPLGRRSEVDERSQRVVGALAVPGMPSGGDWVR
jgi:hypothetical protein